MSYASDLARIERRTTKNQRRYRPVSDNSAQDLALIKRDRINREYPGAPRRLARRAR